MAIEQYTLDAPLIASAVSSAGTASVEATTALQTALLAEMAIQTLALQAAAINMGGCWEKLADIEIRMRKFDARMEIMQTGMAHISNTLSETATTQQMAYLDQTKNNEFQQQTTNASLARAGHPPTVVQPQDLLVKLQKNIEDTTILKGEVMATNLVSNFITDGIGEAYKTSYEWVATSAVGVALTGIFTMLETKVSYVFSKEFIKDAIDFSERQVQKIKAGGE
jgi:hypothetical protein